ncbi:hypothetical protein BDD43_1701 [Mucilaginibacter gracilis]|uniref:Uncharacterized protein n=1 Tax=Mucilaginibacter gracilis TaxID=423350 RepID=A0A495IZU0_9SPHI|nr:hypothetical protein [Mucilaginibacter gracilis]RKR81554.1 hypothetical protein BDD43_1701 [Mucilaginibacter gracilis]
MKNVFTKGLLVKTGSVLLLLLLAFVVNSCRKNSDVDYTDIADPEIQRAMAWYNAANPISINTNNSQSLTTFGNKGGVHKADLSQIIRPDWHRTKKYSRYNQAVIETAIDPSHKILSSLRNIATNKDYAKKEYSRSSYLIINDGANYQAYVMTVIADSAYLKGDLTKLDRNTYSKHEADFSGLVIYTTPKGDYVRGYAYKNGHIITPGTTSSQTTQSTSGNLKTDNVAAPPKCTDYYLVVWDTETGEILSVDFLYTLCDNGDPGDNSGDSGTPPTIPPRCPPSSIDTTMVESITTGKLHVNVIPLPPPDGGGDDGFPPPNPNPDPCNPKVADPAVVTIVNNVLDPCLRAMVAAAISRNIQLDLNKSMNGIFNSNTNFNLEFIDGTLAPSLSGVTNVIDRNGTYDSGQQRLINVSKMSLQIELNSSLSGASQEFITATILHEVLHAYFRTIYSTATFDHEVMVKEYLPWFMSALQSIYPRMTEFDQKSLAYGGLTDTVAFISSADNSMLNFYLNNNTTFRDGSSGTPCNH